MEISLLAAEILKHKKKLFEKKDKNVKNKKKNCRIRIFTSKRKKKIERLP